MSYHVEVFTRFLNTFLLIVLIPSLSHAGWFFTLAGLYQDDSVSFATTEGGGTNWGLFQMGTNFGMKYPVYLGFQYGQLIQTKISTGAITDRYTVTDSGLLVTGFFPPKKPILQVSAGYNFSSDVIFERTGGSAQQSPATSYWASAGAEVEFVKGWFLGGKLVYYSLTPTKNFTIDLSGTERSISGARTMVIPQFIISWRSL